MWLELIVKPIAIRLGYFFLWWDNCPSHLTLAVTDFINEINSGTQGNILFSLLYPINCTDILQILDLVVNGPIKSNIRKRRAKRIYEHFQSFTEKVSSDFSTMTTQEQQSIKFKPPIQTMVQGITDLIDLLEHFNSDDSSLKGVVKAFISTGCAPSIMNDGSISFIQYDQSSIEQNSKLNIIPSNAQTASSNLLSNPNNDENDNITSISTEEFIDSFEPSSDIDEEYDDDELAEQFDLGLDVLLDL
jgi:hypothetical protein